LHRIGRTGRFDTKGIAITIIDGKEDNTEKEMECVRQLEQFYSTTIEELKSIEDLPEIYNQHFKP